MKLGIVVNDIATETPGYTSTHLAFEAHRRGHEVSYIGLQDFSLGVDEQVHAQARRAPTGNYTSAHAFLAIVKSEEAIIERLAVDQLDVLFLRNDPSIEFFSLPWARLAAVNFGRLAMRHGVIVVNDPDGLTHAINKMYLQMFPAAVRPTAVITRDKTEILDFASSQGGRAVIKPLQGSGGRNVFMLRLDQPENIDQMITAVLQDGYVIAQEYLPAISEGDTRLFMLNGKVMEYEGAIAALRRKRVGGDLRTNLTVGAERATAEVTAEMLACARQFSPRLVADGMFFVGLDVVGDKVIEVNVFSPGALVDASRLAEANFMEGVIVSLEQKVAHKQDHPGALSNLELSTFEVSGP